MHDHQSEGKLQVSVLNTLPRWQYDWLKDQSMIKGKNFVSASTNVFFQFFFGLHRFYNLLYETNNRSDPSIIE